MDIMYYMEKLLILVQGLTVNGDCMSERVNILDVVLKLSCVLKRGECVVNCAVPPVLQT